MFVKEPLIKTWLATWFYSIFCLSRRDSELNGEPNHNSSNAFLLCRSNLKNLSAHNYVNVFFLKALIAIHNLDVIFTSETYLNSNTPSGGNFWIQFSSFICFELKMGDKTCNSISLETYSGKVKMTSKISLKAFS